MIDDKIIQNIKDEYWFINILHWFSLVLPGFAYIYFSKKSLLYDLDIVKIIFISIFYSMPGYLITKFLIDHKKIREYNEKRNNELDTTEKEILKTEMELNSCGIKNFEYGKFLREKIKKIRIQFDIKTYFVLFIIYFSLYSSIFWYHSSLNSSYHGFNKFLLIYHVHLVILSISLRVAFKFSKFLNK